MVLYYYNKFYGKVLTLRNDTHDAVFGTGYMAAVARDNGINNSGTFANPVNSKKGNELVAGDWVKVYAAEAVVHNIISFKSVDSNGNKVYATVTYNIVTGKGGLAATNIIAEDGAYPNDGKHSDGYWYVRGYSLNNEPIVSVTTPTNNQTLYENDVFNINGTVLDVDSGNTVTVRYQINTLTTRSIKAFLSDGKTLESFSKSLTFKGGNLYDGTTLIAENLSDGVAHTLKVWATDDQGGTSVIKEIPFHVVPNRAPLLTVNSPGINGLIDSDKFKVDGTFEDSDGNTTVVSYRINGSTSVQIAEGVSGPFTFDVSFGQLAIGANHIVIEAVDSYGAKVSKTIKLNKNEVKSEQLRSTARYKINPPTGSAKAVLLWIQRDKNLDIDVSVSMTMQGEAESFTPLSVSNSAPLDYGSSIIEDEFYHEADSAKDNIILQIDMERASLAVNDKIYLVSGVLD